MTAQAISPTHPQLRAGFIAAVKQPAFLVRGTIIVMGVIIALDNLRIGAGHFGLMISSVVFTHPRQR